MIKTFKLLLLTLSVLFISLVSSSLTSQAASHNTIPTSLRGTWFQTKSTWNQHSKEVPTSGYHVMQVHKHTVTTWQINNTGKRTSKKLVVLASKYNHDYRHLRVTKVPLFNKQRHAWNLPDMRLQNVQPKGRKQTISATDGWAFWSFKKTFKHHSYRLLGTYQRQGYVDIWSKKKRHHVFSYQTSSNKQLRKLGVKN